MATQEFRRYVCWNVDRIRSVINKDANEVGRAPFLATHTPLAKITWLHPAQGAGADKGETALLRNVIERGARDEHTFALIQGAPGTGKSHLIRWLKELYGEERGGRDEVLLIARASNSLRGTLEQILRAVRDSNSFDLKVLDGQLERLRSATNTLSWEGLADSILNNLQVAVGEVPLPEGERPNKRIAKWTPGFLLDSTLRHHLKQPGGPIARIVQHLSLGSGGEGTEIPRFEAADFDLDPAFLGQLEGSSKDDALRLAHDLVEHSETRSVLASFLNRLLRFSIERSAALSPEDLKDIFFELRRQLRRQNRGLALFIEDITAFTGLDLALVDLLVTQHTGEVSGDLCRILSVVGITDGYYDESFPDNIKDRVTLRLSLNDAWKPSGDTGQIASLAARYLNALRIDADHLENWAASGARSERLPSGCALCTFREECHAVFGAETLDDSGLPERSAGLYPFNKHALLTMYEGLQAPTPTPRLLLDRVIQYVLQAHTGTILQGNFPPALKELGGGFRAPVFASLVQRQALPSQAGVQEPRVETLVLFWGDRSIAAGKAANGEPTIGGVPAAVFRAFDLNLIEGVSGDKRSTPLPPPAEHEESSEKRDGNPPPPIGPNKYEGSIQEWLRGGRLSQYQELREDLAAVLRASVDWDQYGVPASLVGERIQPRRIQIEGQAGRVGGDVVTLTKSAQLGAALLAATSLRDNSRQLDDSAIATHLSSLSYWRRVHEEALAEFVLQPAANRTASRPLQDVLLSEALLLSCLSGSLRSSASSARELFLRIIKDCAPPAALPSADNSAHSKAWNDLLRTLGINRTAVDDVRKGLLQALNVPQGDAKEIRFVDAASALDAIAAFRRTDWRLASLGVEEEETASEHWVSAVKLHTRLERAFDAALEGERIFLAEHLMELQAYLGEEEPGRFFTAYEQLLVDLAESKEGTSLQAFEKKAPRELGDARQALQGAVSEEKREALVLRLSALGEDTLRLQSYLARFKGFHEYTERRREKLTDQITSLQQTSGAAAASQQIMDLYAEIERTLERALDQLVRQAEGVA